MTGNGHLTAADILAKAKAGRIESFPTSLGDVYLRSLSEREHAAWQSEQVDNEGVPIRSRVKKSRAVLVSMCLVDPNGARLFENADDLLDVEGGYINELFSLARQHSKLEAVEDEDELEELEGN